MPHGKSVVGCKDHVRVFGFSRPGKRLEDFSHLVVEVPGFEKPLSVTETNDFGADDLPLGAAIRLAYDPDALVAMGD